MEKIIDPESRTAPYKQIADWLESRIRRGDLHERGRVPSGPEIVELTGVNRATAAKAITELEGRGFKFSVEAGQGRFVDHVPPADGD